MTLLPGLRKTSAILGLVFGLVFIAACSSNDKPGGGPDGAGTTDGGSANPPPSGGTWCAIGADVPRATVPADFCLRQFASIPEARTLSFAPNGDLFVGAPSTPSVGGAEGGLGAIFALSDDDHDGSAELHIFADHIEDVHGLAVASGFVYYTTAEQVFRTAYVDGQRAATGTAESLSLPARYGMGGRWTHGLAVSRTGDVVTSRGEYGTCGASPGGEISVAKPGSLAPMATGLRNPMYLRCHRDADVCAAAELGEDQQTGAREKLISLRMGTDYGYPCCYTKDLVALGAPANACGMTAAEDASFPLSDTPFGFDWERGLWPAPYQNALFVSLHGSAYSRPAWAGARIVYATTDPTTRMPNEDWKDFVTGFGSSGETLNRPSDATFAPDGRLFFSDDQAGVIYWIAPRTLAHP